MNNIDEKNWLKIVSEQKKSKESIIKEKLSSVEKEIIDKSILVKINRCFNKYYYLSFAIILILLLIKIISGLIFLIAIIALIIIKKANLHEVVEDRALRKVNGRTVKLQDRRSELIEEFNKVSKWYYDKLDKRCVNWSTYPPDWEIRRFKVFERDGHSCRKCGWPKGFKRRRRELHIHHIVPVAKGGTHNIENLITLCNICHSKVDSKHNLVRNIGRKKLRR